MIRCNACNVFLQNKSYSKHIESARHIKNTQLPPSEPPPEPEPEQVSEPPPPPTETMDAIVNLFRFSPEIYENMTKNGIVKTVAELLLQRLSEMENAPFYFKDGAFHLYYRGKWILENLQKIESEMESDEPPSFSKYKILEIIEMFIENMKVQFHRYPELQKYNMIGPEINNGYRIKNQLRIIKKLAVAPKST